ncbi:aldose epimerase family protein [Olivibacter domesticus]|uniref:Aldose 1-epimerase n=1 Tax=Olivibacter domesticus TaxID=407022 RepID=A0A1H7M169_OLID1|nr:aldose epimerase family protein [Olivibacter domesticus]SEL04934.1 aldose 1-epimerase [Olivibacter domesticus]
MKQLLLKNKSGIQVGITNLGATLTKLLVPDRNGKLTNVVLSYLLLPDYIPDPYYIGATIGRYANRIKAGKLTIDNKCCQLSVNEVAANNHLHGGFSGFSKKLWQIVKQTDDRVDLAYTSSDNEEGYPGKLNVIVSFLLNNDNELWIHYQATTNKTTIVNLCNHSYFNLSDSSDIRTHHLQIHTEYYTPADEHNIPIGSIASVENTIFDFRKDSLLNAAMLKFDTVNYVFGDKRGLQLMATLMDKLSGRCLQISSTQPGMQLYFGNYLSDPFQPYQALCLEPQHFPDAPNKKAFPSPILKPSERYSHSVCYKFSIV